MNKKQETFALSKTVADLRVSYAMASLDIDDTAPDPFAQFHHWLEDAITSKIPEPNAMTLSTVGASGSPSSRTLLLKGIDERGLTFFTNYQSRKGQEIAANPHVSVTFLWKELQRQTSLQGLAEKTSREESEAYFHSRPRGHQIGAWVSEQSREIPHRAWMEDREHLFNEKFPANAAPIPLPDSWGGYRILPHSFEFWQGRESRLHDRILYTLAPDGNWTRSRLSP